MEECRKQLEAYEVKALRDLADDATFSQAPDFTATYRALIDLTRKRVHIKAPTSIKRSRVAEPSRPPPPKKRPFVRFESKRPQSSSSSGSSSVQSVAENISDHLSAAFFADIRVALGPLFNFDKWKDAVIRLRYS